MQILLLLPCPPPFAGPEIMAKEIIDSHTIRGLRNVNHINSTIRDSNTTKGYFDLRGILAFLGVYFKLLKKLPNCSSLFMYLSSNKVGFLRDSFYVVTCRLFGKKCVAQYHGGHFKEFYWSQGVLYRKLIRIVLNMLNCLVLLGKNITKDFQSIYEGNIRYLPNGLNLEAWPLNEKKTRGNSPFTIFFMGHLTYSKGFHDLIEAYKILFDKHNKSVKLLFAGEFIGYQLTTAGFLTGHWKEVFLKRGRKICDEIYDFISNCRKYNAEYLGIIGFDEKLAAFKKSDLFVLPSYTEGLSIACLEAMASGLPVIVTPVGAMPEVIIDGENGFLCPVGDPEALATSIESLLLNRHLVKQIGNNNTFSIRENYDIEKVAKKLLQILNSCSVSS